MIHRRDAYATLFRKEKNDTANVRWAVEGYPSLHIEIDRRAIARYGLTIADVQDVIATAIGGRSAGLVFQGDRRFDIIVRLPDELRSDLQAIERLPIPLRAVGAETTRG